MSSDAIYLVGQVATFAGIGILVFAAIRAFQIRRALTRGVYQSRASWIGAILILATVTNLSGDLYPNGTALLPVAFASVVVLLAFVDTSIRATQESDFFHRSALGWPRLRKALYVILVGSLLVLSWALYFTSLDTLPALLAAGQFFVVIGLLFSYSAAALVVGARRTPDRAMRRFVMMLSLALVSLAIYFLIWAPFNVIIPGLGDTISYFFSDGAAYFLYRAVMSLSPLGRVRMEEVGVSQVDILRQQPVGPVRH